MGALSIVLAVSAGPSLAQSTPPAADNRALMAPAEGPAVRADGRGATLTARYRVRQMENVLERAVQHAADMMRRRLQNVTPDLLALAGTPRAQGFRIDGYGLFFSVEVPRLSESVNWALRALSQDRDERVLASLRTIAASEQDPVLRADLERAIRTMALQVPGAANADVSSPTGGRVPAPAPPSLPASRAVEAATVADAAPAAPEPVQPPVAAAAATPEPMADPSAAYEFEVKQALADAMLDYAGSLELPSTEWVTVAARDAGYVAFPDAVTDMVTVTLSVRVADLLEYRAQRLTRADARARVVVREF